MPLCPCVCGYRPEKLSHDDTQDQDFKDKCKKLL